MANYTNIDHNGNHANTVPVEYIKSLFANSPFFPITDMAALKQIMALAQRATLQLDSEGYFIPEWMYDKRGLALTNPYEKDIYAYLYGHRNDLRQPGGLSQKNIVEKLGYSQSTVKRTIASLVKKGLIRRIEAKVDQAIGGSIFGASAYEILQDPINKAILNCAPTDGTSLSGVNDIHIALDGSITLHKGSNDDGNGQFSKNPQDSPWVVSDPTVETSDVENSNPQDSPWVVSDPTVEFAAADGHNRPHGSTCENNETAKTDSASSTCENVTNPQDSSLIDSHYREDEEEEEEEGYIQGLGGVTSGTSRDNVVGTVGGGQDVTGAVAIPCPSPAVPAEGCPPAAEEEPAPSEPSDPLAADQAFGLTVVESKAFRALVATSRKTAARSPESIRRARIAFRERLADGWTPRQLVKAYKFYVLNTYENVKPGTPEERKQSRFEKFPATWLSSESDVALWDRTAGGNGMPEGVCAHQGQPSSANGRGPAFPSAGASPDRPADGAANETVVHGVTVKIMRMAGGWCYRDRFKTFCDLGRGTENLTREQALALAASKVEAQFQSTPAYNPATIEQVVSSGRSGLAPSAGSPGGGTVKPADGQARFQA